MAITTDTGAKKIAGTDNWRDIFDDHNDTVDAYDANIASITDGLAIMANGNTHAAIAAGQAVYVRNHSTLAAGLYWANTAIATNGTLSTGNLTADASGGLNKLKGDIDSLNSNKKNTQTAVSNPTASGTATAFVSDITQNTQGVITPTRKSVPTASTSVAGLVQLNNTLTSTSTTQALTAAQGKALNDKLAKTTLTTYKEWSTSIQISVVQTGNIVHVSGWMLVHAGTYTSAKPILVITNSRPNPSNVYCFDNKGHSLRLVDNNSRGELIFHDQVTLSADEYLFVNFTYLPL